MQLTQIQNGSSSATQILTESQTEVSKELVIQTDESKATLGYNNNKKVGLTGGNPNS